MEPFKYFKYLDKFTRVTIITFILLGLVTPFIVRNYQILTSRAQTVYNIETISSGDWSNPSIWNTNTVPTTNDNVKINKDHTIIYDVLKDEVLGELAIEGTLKFSRTTNTRLKTNDNIMVNLGGFLDMGTPADQIPKTTKAEVIFVFPTTKIFTGGPGFMPEDTGLWAMDGSRWEVHGAPLVRTWSKLVQNAPAGATTLLLEKDVSDWYVGGSIIITATNVTRGYYIREDGREMSEASWQGEVRKIVQLEPLSGGTTRITLDVPLSHAHEGTEPIRAAVGLLTRNIVVTTEGQGIDQNNLNPPFDSRRFAHTIYMHGSIGNISYAEFRRMGHTRTLSRYPVHLHALGDDFSNKMEPGSGTVIRGNSVWISGHRFYVIHDTNGALIEDNVGFNGFANGYYLEKSGSTLEDPNAGRFCRDCPEGPHDNVFSHNLGAYAYNTENANDTNFWLDHLDQIFLGNYASGGGATTGGVGANDDLKGGGFGTSEGSNGSGRIQIPLFIKNEAISNFTNGLWTWNNNVPSDMAIIEFSAIRNGTSGMRWGAYGADYRFYQSQFIENGRFGLDITSTRSHLQDTLVRGGSSSNSTIDTGFKVGNYPNPTQPGGPIRLIRTTFKDHRTQDFSQVNAQCSDSTLEKQPTAEGTISESCAALYMESHGSQFLSNTPFRFGHTANANSFWRMFGRTGFPDQLYLRPDQLDLTKQGVVSGSLITPQTVLDTTVNALVTPMSAYPSQGISFPDLKDADGRTYSYTFVPAPDYPPEAQLSVSLSGQTAQLTAAVTDDNAVSTIEFFADERKIGEGNSAVYDLSTHGRKFAYLYVRAYDDKNQVSYSKVTEIGPEVLGVTVGKIGETLSSGNWSDKSIWGQGVIPKAGDKVTIKQGHTVVYDVASDEMLGEISIEGTLKFSRTTNTRLKTNGNIMVQMGGFLDMGTAADPIPKTTKAEVIWQLTQAQAAAYVPVAGHMPVAASPGLYTLDGGKWEVYGFPLVRTWSKLAQDAPAGATSLIVENDVSEWYGGGTITISQTSIGAFQKDENEVNAIAALEKLADGKTKITLAKPLQYKHEGTHPFRGEVGLLTRNVVLKTELLGVSDATLQSDVRTRKFAHTVYMHNSKGNVQYAEFKYMGHYANLGTYAIHHHAMLGTSKGMMVRGNSGWYNGFRCVNLHVSHGVLVEDNVCFNAQSSAFFQEIDPVQFNVDNAFIHNLAIATKVLNRNDNDKAGEGNRMGAFWGSDETVYEAFLGNVAAGTEFSTIGGEGESAGFLFPEIGRCPVWERDVTGTLFFTFVKNEAHSGGNNGIFSWTNCVPIREMIEPLLWRNGKDGFMWGAYETPFKVFNAKILQNGKKGINALSVSSFVQDSLVTGAPGSTESIGYSVLGYIRPQYPGAPLWNVRNTFKDFTNYATTHEHDADNVCLTKPQPVPVLPNLESRPVLAHECGAAYQIHAGNTFENVTKVFDIGRQANPSSWWKVQNYTGPGGLPINFVAVRKDQLDPTKQGVLPKKLVNAQTTYSSVIDALVTPLETLPANIAFTGLLNWANLDKQFTGESADFTFSTTAFDYPPQVILDATLAGKVVTLKASATDDKQVDRVEFFVDWMKVGADAAVPYEITVDLSKLPDPTPHSARKYAYLYARAFDGVSQIKSPDAAPNPPQVAYAQRAYSNVIELGPEVLLAGQPLPTPTPLLSPTPTSTPIPTNTPTPQPSPTASAGTATPTPAAPTPTSTPIPTFTVSGIVFIDTNGNGAIDTGEGGFGGGTVTSVPQIGFPQVATTDTAGNYNLTNLKTGAFTITFSLPVGFNMTTTNNKVVNLPPSTTVNFGIVPIPTATPIPTNTSTLTRTPTPTPKPTPIILSVDHPHIFLDRGEKLTLSGNNFPLTETMRFRLKLANGTRLEAEITPKDSSTLEVDISNDDEFRSLTPGFHTIELERTSDATTIIFPKQLLLTKLGDLWSPTATDTSEQKRDGTINIFDVSRLLAKWNSTLSSDLSEADINGPNGLPDGKIDIWDANTLMRNWSP